MSFGQFSEPVEIQLLDDGRNVKLLVTYIPKLGEVPLDFQPGAQWRYSALAGIETLGRIVEVVSGQTFDQYLKQTARPARCAAWGSG